MQSNSIIHPKHFRFFRDGVIWKNLLVIYFAWFSTLMVHFGLIRRSVRQDTGDIYTNFFLMDSTEMIAIVVSLFTINRCADITFAPFGITECGNIIAQSQGLLESFCVSSSGNFLLVWLHSSCSMAHRPGELTQKLSSKPCNQAIDTLCSGFSLVLRTCCLQAQVSSGLLYLNIPATFILSFTIL